MAKFLHLKFESLLKQVQKTISQALEFGHRGYPAFALDAVPSAEILGSEQSSKSASPLDSLFDGFLWGACPKHRRSRERRAIRQFGFHKVREYMTPKKNIVECLECGHWHEALTICGNCYLKVREETELMKAKMDPHARLYNTPQTEVVYIYKGEEDSKQLFQGKYIVEMDKPRPEWFPKNLLTKGHGKY